MSKGAQPRPDPGNGSDSVGFFATVVKGEQGRPANHPYSSLIDTSGVSEFLTEYERRLGHFDTHIACSIPGYREVQAIIGHALVRTFLAGADMLDIGASEGSLIKAISAASRGLIRTVGLDANHTMAESYHTSGGGAVEGASYVVGAFGPSEKAGELAWLEPDCFEFEDSDGKSRKVQNPHAGKPVYYYQPPQKLEAWPGFTIIHAAMTFQFISDEREEHVKQVKSCLAKDGIFIIQEKLFSDNETKYKVNERKKDLYKGRFFSHSDIRRKAKAVLGGGAEVVGKKKGKRSGMAARQIYDDELEQSLCGHFDVVVQFWDAGNFKGYVASADAGIVERFLGNLSSTYTAGYSTVSTPRYVQP